MPKFERKDGSLTVYAFMCGYIQRHQSKKRDIRIDLYHEGAVYQVRRFDASLPYLEWNAEGSGRRWESFETLTEARKQFAKWKHEIDN